MRMIYKTNCGKEFDRPEDARVEENMEADYKDQFEEHCEEYSLYYDFALLGNGYRESETHKAYILYKSML